MTDLTLYSNLKEEDYLEDVANLTLPQYLLNSAQKVVDGELNADWLVRTLQFNFNR